ncbi:MAG: Gfo/Idh/MocA family oxidoreductase [Caldilineaceae bacterium]
MLRIGILGSDNSHAERFAELLNLADHPDYIADADARVVAIWGQEAERTAQVATNNQIETIVAEPTAMLGQVDAVLCVTRHGGLHYELVRPYLTAGIPTFVDKPLAISADDARTIVALAAQHRVPFSSFSTVQFSVDAQDFLQAARQLGGVRMGSYSGPATRRNPYGGVLFYAIHSVELMLAVQGTGVQWVQAMEGNGVDADENGAMVAVCAWPNGMMATLELSIDAKYAFRATALGREGVHSATLNIRDCYRQGMHQILAVLRGAPSPVQAKAMIEAIQIGEAIELSLQEERRVYLYEV